MTDTMSYDAVCDSAEVLLQRLDTEQAIALAHQACARHPELPRAYLIISQCLAQRNDLLSALETAEMAWLLVDDETEPQKCVRHLLTKLRQSTLMGAIVRPLAELSAFGFYSKVCKRFLRLKLFDAAGRAVELAQGEKSDTLLQSAAINIDSSLCNWDRFEQHRQSYIDFGTLCADALPVSPLMGLYLSDDRYLHLNVAKRFVDDHAGHRAVLIRKMRVLGKLNRRPRVGYLSADFHSHATSRLLVGVLEQHNRRAWEIIGLSYGRNDGSDMRLRVEASFERFIDFHGKPVEANLHAIRSLDLDILIDVKGFTSEFEAAYTLARPAPVIVNYLAYPGTMGSSAYDYILGDKVVTPFEHQDAYSECIVQLPDSYQCNDATRSVALPLLTRAEVGLPESSVVIAAFNNVKKITPSIFGAWMQILAQVPTAVIWLVCRETTARHNLRKSARQHGIDPERLVFTSDAPLEQHMSRHHLADFFLDTYPYNAHTTASDALWMGLPVVTLRGESFASRVAASLLTSVGLTELIATTQSEYIQLAVRLAHAPECLAHYRTYLSKTRTLSPLFDSKRYARNLEQAFSFMVDRSRKGKAAHPFEVRDLSLGGGVRLAGSPTFKSVVGAVR